MSEQLTEIMEQLKYYNIKWIKDGQLIRFQMRNKNNKVIATLRYFSEDNFDIKSKWYRETESIIKHLKSDYNYVVSYRLDCQ